MSRLLRLVRQISPRELRSAAIGTLIVFGGLGLAALTLYAHSIGDLRLAGISAGISLVLVLLIVVFVVPPMVRNARREASQMDLPFEFTTGGAVMIVLILVVGFSAWNTGNNLLFLILSFLLAAVAVGFLAGNLSVRRLSVRFRFPDPIYAREAAPIEVDVTNNKLLLPAFSVVVDIRGTDRENSTLSPELRELLPKFILKRVDKPPIVRRTVGYAEFVRAKCTAESRIKTIFDHRGRFVIRDFEVTTQFPFGFFRHRRRLAADGKELFVLPAIVDVESPAATLHRIDGKRSSRTRGSGNELLGLREYLPFDDPRNIDWKATARTSRLTVRDHAAETESCFLIIFDTFVQDSDADRFEKGVELTASLISELRHTADEIHLFTAGQEGTATPAIGWKNALRRLAVIGSAANEYELNTAIERIEVTPGVTDVLLITSRHERDPIIEGNPRLTIVKF